jgi:hypothetical protein
MTYSKINRKEEVEVELGKGGEMEQKHGASLTVKDDDTFCGEFFQQKATSFKLPKSMIFQTDQLTSLYISSSFLIDAGKNPMQLQLYFPGDAPCGTRIGIQ